MTVGDNDAEGASLTLAAEGVQAGMTGAAGLAGSRFVLRGQARRQLGLDTDAVVELLCTQGVTDPGNTRECFPSKQNRGRDGANA